MTVGFELRFPCMSCPVCVSCLVFVACLLFVSWPELVPGLAALAMGDSVLRRSARLHSQQPQGAGEDEQRSTDPAWERVPVGPGVWAFGETVEGTRVAARYTDSEREETTEFQYERKPGQWVKVMGTNQAGYKRLQFRVQYELQEERRNRVFCYLVHGAPPGQPAEFHADHTSKTEDGRWARQTGPVVWLHRTEHGRKHGHEGAEEARKRRRTAQGQGKAGAGDA